MNRCPDFSLLSQFFDHELEAGQENEIRQHLQVCPDCRVQITRMERAEERVRAVFIHAPAVFPLRELSHKCLSPETVAAYVQRMLSVEEERSAEQHLQTCGACVNDVQDAVRIAAVLAESTREPVPAALKAQVVSLWEGPQTEDKPTAVSRVVLQIARQGLRVLEQTVVAPVLAIQGSLTPLPAYRAGDSLVALNLKIEAGQAAIQATIVQEGEGIALKLALVGAGQETLAGQRIFLRQQGRAIFSAKTDEGGLLRIPHLEPGVYEVTCSGIHTTFQLELRS